MSSFFKGSCFIFWTTWILCLSYFVGSGRFFESHVVDDEEMNKNARLIYLLCVMNMSFAFIGCCFLKCNVNNIFCTILYVVPVGLVIPILATMNAVRVSKNQARPSREEVMSMIKKYYVSSKHASAPLWLSQTERDYKCCGIDGPEDYRKLFRSVGKDTCMNIEVDIPCSCCALLTTHDPDDFDLSRTIKIESCRSTGRNSSKCLDSTKSREWMKNVFENMTLDMKCDETEDDFKLIHSLVRTSNGTGVMHAKGCYNLLMANYQRMKSCHFVFFILFAILPLLMLIAYGRFFCQSSVLTGVRSDYSLDVETLSMIDAPYTDPHSAISKHFEKNT